MLDLPAGAEVVKTYQPRGPLQQYRLEKSHSFTCSRCQRLKISKLLTVVAGREDLTICNGCYGYLLSVWDIKSGDLPEGERDDAIVALLASALGPEAVAAAADRLTTQAAHPGLLHEAQQMLATAHAVTAVLRTVSGLDWSAAIICFCKAVEIEVTERVVQPVRVAVAGGDLTADLSDADLKRLARYCSNQAPPPEFGALAYTLKVASRSRRRLETSPIVRALHALASRRSGSEWILEPDGLVSSLNELTGRLSTPPEF
jgi:hypothetical protein